MVLSPVEKGELKLCHPWQKGLIVLALAHLLTHVLADLRDTRVVLMLTVADEQVELGVLLHLYTQLIESLDRSVASKEVLWTRTEGDNLQAF